MSVVPHTNAHTLNAETHVGDVDPIDHNEIGEIKRPVQLIRGDGREGGFASGIYDLGALAKWYKTPGFGGKDPLTRKPIDWYNYDEVVWDNAPEGLDPNYLQKTTALLEALRAEQQHSRAMGGPLAQQYVQTLEAFRQEQLQEERHPPSQSGTQSGGVMSNDQIQTGMYSHLRQRDPETEAMLAQVSGQQAWHARSLLNRIDGRDSQRPPVSRQEMLDGQARGAAEYWARNAARQAQQQARINDREQREAEQRERELDRLRIEHLRRNLGPNWDRRPQTDRANRRRPINYSELARLRREAEDEVLAEDLAERQQSANHMFNLLDTAALRGDMGVTRNTSPLSSNATNRTNATQLPWPRRASGNHGSSSAQQVAETQSTYTYETPDPSYNPDSPAYTPVSNLRWPPRT